MHPFVSAQGNDQLINSLADELSDRKTVEQAIDKIVSSEADARKRWLQSILDGKLYIRKSDKQVFFTEKTQAGFTLRAAVDNSPAGQAGKRDVRKIKINNALRSKLRLALARLSLQDPDATVRYEAVEQMIDSLGDENVSLIDSLVQSEPDDKVQKLMVLAVDLHRLDSGSEPEIVAAIENVGLNTRPSVTRRLQALSESDNANVAEAALQSLTNIQSRISLFEKVETLLFGLSLGSVLAMAAIGLAITFGVMGVINMAHGEMIMLGAYCTWFLQTAIPGFTEYSLVLAIPFAFGTTFLIGVVIEFLVIRHLYGRPLETLLATFGISLLLQQSVRTLVSPQNVPVSNPEWLSGQWEIDPALSIAVNRLVIFFFCLLVFMVLMWVLRKTFFGLKVRAVSQNRQMARAMGAHSSRIDSMTFGLGAGIAGVAGVALSQLTNVGPNMGQSYIVDSFMVVVFGGVGNLWGTLLAGLTLGVANKFLEPWVGAVLAKIVVLVFIILFIQRYPRGLFPQRGRAAGN